MKRPFLGFSTIGVLLLCLVSTGKGLERENAYTVGGSIGYFRPSKPIGDAKDSGGMGFGFAFRFALSEHFYLTAGLNEHGLVPKSDLSRIGDFNIHLVELGLTGCLYLPSTKRLSPYVFGGTSQYWERTTITLGDVPLESYFSESYPGVVGGLGFDLPVARNLSFYGEIKEHYIFAESSVPATQVSLGLSFHFKREKRKRDILLDMKKLSEFLNLTEEQIADIEPKVKRIKEIVEEWEEQRKNIGESFPRGRWGYEDGPDSSLVSFHEKRAAMQREIDSLVSQIKELLTDEQLKKFAEVKVPQLDAPEGRRRRGWGRGD